MSNDHQCATGKHGRCDPETVICRHRELHERDDDCSRFCATMGTEVRCISTVGLHDRSSFWPRGDTLTQEQRTTIKRLSSGHAEGRYKPSRRIQRIS